MKDGFGSLEFAVEDYWGLKTTNIVQLFNKEDFIHLQSRNLTWVQAG